MLKKLLAAVGTLALVFGLVALVSAPASAHTPKIDATCTTLTVTLTYYNADKANTVSVWTDGTEVVTDKAFPSSFSGTYTFSTGKATHSYEVKVSAGDDPTGANNWSFDTKASVTGCETGITAAAVTTTAAYCTAAGTVGGGGYIVPTSPHVTYQKLSGSTWSTIAASTYPLAVGDKVSIRAVADSGYKLTGTTEWDNLTVSAPSTSTCIVPTPPTTIYQNCTATPGQATSASYTAPSSTGYSYYLDGSKTPLVANTPYPVTTFPSTVVIVAVADSSHTIPTGSTVKWTYNFAATPACLGDSVYVNPSATHATCAAPGVPGNNTYTIPSAVGAHFTVKIGSGAEIPVTAGTYSLGTDAVNIVITAYPDDHYKISGQTVFPFPLEAAPDCLTPVTPKVTPTDAVCTTDVPGTTPGTYTLAAVTGVTYHVVVGNAASITQKSGTFDVPSGATVTVTATADPKYKLTGSFLFQKTYASAGDCTLPTTSGSVKFTDQVCNTETPGQSFAGDFVITQGGHVTYKASISSVDNGGYKTVSAGTTPTQVTPGDVVTIMVIPDTGYVLTPVIVPADWTHTYPANNECLSNATVVKPDFASQVCVTDGQLGDTATGTLTDAYITIPNTPGVQYSINDVATNYDPETLGKVTLDPGTYQVRAAAKTGYILDDSYPVDGWKFILTSDETCGQETTLGLVDPTAASTPIGCFTSGSYTLGNNLDGTPIADPNAIIWTVNGSTVAAGPYTVTTPGTYAVHAVANSPTYGLETDAQTDWTFTFSTPTACDLKTLALTGSSPTGWIALGYLMLVSGLALVAVRLVRRRGDQS